MTFAIRFVAVMMILTGVGVSGVNPATAAPVCVVNRTEMTLVLMVDDLAGQRAVQAVQAGGQLCLPVALNIEKAVVGVFASEDALEGCSRLTRPGQAETLLEFKEFDNCGWADTDRNFP